MSNQGVCANKAAERMAKVPVFNMHMMSDQEWESGARENAIHNYKKTFGKDPESVETAVKWQRARVAALLRN